jgi:hypothetical protein
MEHSLFLDSARVTSDEHAQKAFGNGWSTYTLTAPARRSRHVEQQRVCDERAQTEKTKRTVNAECNRGIVAKLSTPIEI